MAIVCCRVCKSTPIIFISASFVPSHVRLEHRHFTRIVARPTSLCHQTGRFHGWKAQTGRFLLPHSTFLSHRSTPIFDRSPPNPSVTSLFLLYSPVFVASKTRPAPHTKPTLRPLRKLCVSALSFSLPSPSLPQSTAFASPFFSITYNMPSLQLLCFEIDAASP